MNILILFGLLTVPTWKICAGFQNTPNKCKETQVVLYNLKFEARWTKEDFPKQYPERRPPAQWSNLIGVTHNESYHLFRIGELASENLKIFAETGKLDFAKNQTNVENYVYDEFFSPAVKAGVGKSEVNFFVDGNHSMVSAAVKMVPSPDWFVGIDAYDLCSEGNWIDIVTVEASPIDAGTDSGFTFTAPNWKTEPQEPIFKITSRYPRHPANSFYYPKLKDLPPIAVFKIEKKNLYGLVNNKSKSDEPNVIHSSQAENEIRKNVEKIYRKRKFVSQRVKCKMSDWSKWSECTSSSTCKSGTSIRTRKIIGADDKKSRRCPHLKEEKVCRDETGCSDNYFKW